MFIMVMILVAFAYMAWTEWLDHEKHIAEIESRARADNEVKGAE